MRDRARPSAGKSAFTQGADLFASVMAVVATYFAGTGVYNLSLLAALDHARSTFGYGWDGVIKPLWWLGCILATFAFCQMAIAASLRLGMAKLARWLFGN